MKFIKKSLNSVATNAIILFVLAKSGISQAYVKIKEKAASANMSLKDYVGNDENIGHISIVFYDVLPLAFKLGLRYEKFHSEFSKKFKTIRSLIYKHDAEQNFETSEVQISTEQAKKIQKDNKPRIVKKSLEVKIVEKPVVKKTTSKKIVNTKKVLEISVVDNESLRFKSKANKPKKIE